MRRLWGVGGVALLCAVGPMRAWADPVKVLFVGNSFTHGRYDPARNDNSGFDSGPGAAAGVPGASVTWRPPLPAERSLVARAHTRRCPEMGAKPSAPYRVFAAYGASLTMMPRLSQSRNTT